eukprot:CAMPEP_0113302482 /NCGR_PEP_ID=MMETSP0010_2-20120614/3279_1 /TAXON_ID=216773 ORGANISM="Corethron hystrix, Strain 308" /NCGR_SAMPLE_ID=MMETSP0010_2 /ASSEMBLY_ACC=CAM_ASM_000155 /LENGTH=82 /DNA_ID=CAMNT_0000156285 /DNA_START=346 /DNA_END=594 /DNA_ORIENTATION=+ /assembly_acc=CAM_ASM_000155
MIPSLRPRDEGIELPAHLLVTAGRRDNDGGFLIHAVPHSIVSSRVAGVQGDKNVHRVVARKINGSVVASFGVVVSNYSFYET